jgi:UDP-N-acetylglucosamine acyltransferase
MSPMSDSRARIHPTAIVEGECDFADGVEVGPYCVVRGRVRLGKGVRLVANVQLNGPVEIGDETVIYPFASIGFPPQDVKFKPGHATAGVRVGKGCQVREQVTLHAATKADIPTSVGDNCFLMVGSHLGHDARIGNHVTLVNNVLLAGHAEVGDNVTLGGAAAVHQFSRIGRLAFISGAVAVAMDIPPFCLSADRNHIHGINLVGLRRAGVARDQITLVRRAFRKVFRPTLPRQEMIAALKDIGKDSPLVMEMAQFVESSKRSIAAGTARPPRALITWLHYARRGEHLEGIDAVEGED